MTWAKLCGSFCFHRKVLEADLLTKSRASGAFARMIAWSAENMTGGKISAAMALTIARDRKVIDALVTVALLERHGGNYTLHDFGDYNPTGEELAARREELRVKRSKAGHQGAAVRWGRGKADGNLPSAQGVPDGTLPSVREPPDGKNHGKRDGNLPSAAVAKDGNAHGKSMPTSPSPSPSLSPPPTVVEFALTGVDAVPETGGRRKSNARMAKHTPEEVDAKNRVVRTFIECFQAKKQVAPKAIVEADHAQAFLLAKRFGADEACSIVRRAFESDFVVRENTTLRYIASKADTFRGAAPKKAHGQREQQQAAGDEPWLREHLS
ncbi:MAG: hypothetical protein ABSC94_26865 [Polyangiaceae bacterium]|jgi:hypothetical protein